MKMIYNSIVARYIPVGLLEVLPQRINERPPPYFGRDDLETLMASPNSKDWVKIRSQPDVTFAFLFFFALGSFSKIVLHFRGSIFQRDVARTGPG